MTDYGTVNYNGKTYTLTQAAYFDRYNDTVNCYYAAATCPDYPDEQIRVYWDIINPDCEDESEACNWDNPAGVKINGREVEAVEP